MTVYADDFTGTAGTALDSHTASGINGGWTWTHTGGVSGDAQINASNQIKVPGAGNGVYLTPTLGSADHYCQANIYSTGGFHLLVRATDSNNFYGGRYNTGHGGWEIYRKVGGTFTRLSLVTASLTAGALGRFEISGSGLTLTVDGVTKGTATDASFTTPQTAGIQPAEGPIDPWIDNFEAGAAAGGGTTSGTAATTSGATGNLTGTGALSATAATTSAATGSLRGLAQLTGTAATVSSAAGTLADGTSPTLSGTAATTSGATATLSGIGALVGASPIVSGAVATLRDAIGHLTGSAAGTSGATGTLSEFVPAADIVANTALSARWELDTALAGRWAINTALGAVWRGNDPLTGRKPN